jgi:uncharacterized protein YrzB (UPF0473 family)
MCQANEAAELTERAAAAAMESEEEFVLELRAHDERRVEGFVLHLKSGRREDVREWNDVTEIIHRILAEEDEPVDGA